MRVALVHDWLTGMRGGEKALEQIAALFPGADVFTLVHVPGSVSPAIEAHPIHTAFIQRLPFVARAYRHYLPLFPAAIERLDLRRLRPGGELQPLRGQVGDRSAGGAASLLLPDPDALRVGSVRRLLRARSASAPWPAPCSGR